MQESASTTARAISVGATVLVAIACGTNYAYSTWAPQFAQRLKLTSTESNVIGNFGNLGMYIPAILVGMVVDAKGPKLGVASGAVLLGLGYTGIYTAFNSRPGTFSVAMLCFFSFLTGCGSCSAFLAALKTAAVNYPNSRGTATGLPLAGFGLSAFIVSSLASLTFQDDTSKFLLMLAILTFSLNTICFFFMRLLPPPQSGFPTRKTNSDSGARGWLGTRVNVGVPCSPTTESERRLQDSAGYPLRHEEGGGPAEEAETQETSSLLSEHPEPGQGIFGHQDASPAIDTQTDIRGLELLKMPDYWLLFFTFTLLSGIGLMNINNIGNDIKALWHRYDEVVSPSLIGKQQSMHVSILSVASCTGRLFSGTGSDLLIDRLGVNRMWWLFASALMFMAAQLSLLQIEDPHLFIFVSVFTGLAYGMLYGFFPSLLSSKFGVRGLSQNWGMTILGPVISGNIFNLLYGHIYDKRSIILPSGDRVCLDGRWCYQTASMVTLLAGLTAIVLSLTGVWKERRSGITGSSR